MGQPFTINTRAIDSDNNQSSESIVVNAGPGSVEIPNISFVFPNVISVEEGGPTGPLWGAGVYRGFAFCLVTPTPSGGDGKFLVQTYYNSGNYPNAPSRRFAQTFDGLGSTLSAQWNFGVQSLPIDGGGIDTYGFASQTDLSGLRKALILSVTDQGDLNNPNRIGGRTLPTDGIIGAYHHDLIASQLKTISIYQKGKETTGGPDRTSWPDDTFIFFHPYHYVPIYTNNGVVSQNVLPRILVIENGNFFPLRGSINGTGNSITGTNTDFVNQMPSGQYAIKFNGNDNWYLVSGIQSSSGLTIYNYGDTINISNQTAVATRYAIGSGLIKVLPNLTGCNLWDVSLTPEYNDGDTIPGSNLTYTANLTGSVSPSGTIKYDWTVISFDGVNTTSSGLVNGGSTLVVPYTVGIKKNVRVNVSGSSQPECVHSDETGLIELKPGIDTGVWSTYLQSQLVNGDTYNNHTWYRLGALPGTGKYFHHWQGSLKHLSVTLSNNVINTQLSTLTAPLGSLSNWPNQGSFVVHHNSDNSDIWTAYWGSYSGKTSNAFNDTLTGVQWHNKATKNARGRMVDLIGSVGTTIIGTGTKTLSLHTNMHMPMTYIISKSNKTVKVEDARRVVDARYGSKKAFWIFSPGASQTMRVSSFEYASVNYDTNEITFQNLIPSNIGKNGDQLVVAPWSHWINGINPNVEENAKDENWNILEQSLFWVLGVNHTGSDAYFCDPEYTISNTASFSLRLWCPLPNILRGTNYTPYRNSANDYMFMWVPPRGRILIPYIDRKNIVLEYTERAFSSTQEGDVFVTLYNCRTIAPESDPSTTTPGGTFKLKTKGVAYLHKTLRHDGVWQRLTLEGTDANITYSDPKPPKYFFNRNDVPVDLIYGNQDPNNQFTGSKGTLLAEPIWEKALSRVSNGYTDLSIPAVDPIYQSSSTNSGGGGGGCIAGTASVEIKKSFAEIPVKCLLEDVKPGYFIKSSTGFDYIQKVMRFPHSTCYKLTTKNRLLKATPMHPIAVITGEYEETYEFKPISQLIIGDKIVTIDGPEEIIDLHEIEQKGVYVDLMVDNSNNFYANGVLVHNKLIINPFSSVEDL